MPVVVTPAMNCPSKRESREESAAYRRSKVSTRSPSHHRPTATSGFRTCTAWGRPPPHPPRAASLDTMTTEATAGVSAGEDAILGALRELLGDAVITDPEALQAL